MASVNSFPMAVYLFTIHAYRSWSKGNRRGYVQHGSGLQPPNPMLAAWRDDHAKFDPVRFDDNDQKLLLAAVAKICAERSVSLYAGTATPTHVHGLVSIVAPACGCGGTDYCLRSCAARKTIEAFLGRLKSRAGLDLAMSHRTKGRPYFSRGWDLTPIRARPHFDYHVEKYLPNHAAQGGIFRKYF